VSNDAYRADREWLRFEGTPQRDLFRQLRERFLARHAPVVEWALDAGSGPGRFSGRLGGPSTRRRVALDLGRAMLEELQERWPVSAGSSSVPALVLGDASRPPFEPDAFGLVAALGNLVGFAGSESAAMQDRLVELLAPAGTLLLEVAPGPGERSRYLARLPASSFARLLRAPARALLPRIDREGFVREPVRRPVPGEFHRTEVGVLVRQLSARGFRVEEIVAVAPALGADPERTAEVARDPKAWDHLLEIEETLGRAPPRWDHAAAVLVAAVAPEISAAGPSGPKRSIK
jgi:hypothetical protein